MFSPSAGISIPQWLQELAGFLSPEAALLTASGNPQCCDGAVPVMPFGSQACLAQLPQHTGTSEALQPSR